MNERLGDLHLGESARMMDECRIAKPRNAHTERAWQAFLRALEDQGFACPAGFPKILSETENSHIVEIVPHSGTDRDGLSRYSCRCGSLLFLVWLLGGRDFHDENLIANGEYPVLIDLEALMTAPTERVSSGYEKSLASSVTVTHLLPTYAHGQDISGFSGQYHQNLPMVDGKEARVQVSEFLDGFETAFRFVFDHKDFVRDKLQLFANCNFRVILRSTDLYARFLRILDGRDTGTRRCLAEELCRIAYSNDQDSHRIEKASLSLKAEVNALTAGWVPVFYTHGDSVSLFCDGRQLDGEPGERTVMPVFLRCSPVEAAEARIDGLTEADLHKQKAIIEKTFFALDPLPAERPAGDWQREIPEALERELVPELPGCYMALTLRDDNTCWGSIGWGLYDGSMGILCALAAMGWEESPLFERIFQDFSENVLEKDDRFTVCAADCALSDGISGLLAGLLHIEELTGRTLYRRAAERLLSHIDPVLGDEEQQIDLLNGLGGLCLQLPKLTGAHSRELARLLLPRMLEANTKLTGAAHGKAGIALALGALQTTLATEEADARILNLLKEEDALFSSKTGNWPDLREKKNKDGFMHGWCSGAPGIGMCRKKLLQYTKNEEIQALCRRDVERAVRYLDACRETKSDTLCCGNAARVMAASYLGTDMPVMRQALARSAFPDAPRLLHAGKTADHNVTLMQGMSGIGYALALTGRSLSGGMLL